MKTARRTLGATLAGLALTLGFASASSADSIYWVNYGADKISHALIPEGGAADVPIPAADVDGPYGLAIDAAAGRIYWLNSIGPGSIGYANVDGSGSGLLNITGAQFANPAGLAINPTAGKIYWGNPGDGTIGWASLNGTGGGLLSTAGTTAEPNGLAIDPTQNRIYWTNFSTDKISYAALEGSGGGDVDTGTAPVDGPEGIAIDPATGRLFWTNFSGNSIGFADPGGGGSGQFQPGTALNRPVGLAFDPYYGGTYWANEGADTLEYYSGAYGGNVQTQGATVASPSWPVIFASPRTKTLPVLTGGTRPGTVLSCANGEWMPDRLGSFLFQAPQSFSYEWTRNEAAIPGATASTITAEKVGRYKCRVYATNAAGRGDAPSNQILVAASLGITGVRVYPKKGIAIIRLKLTGSGSLALAGRGVVAQRKPKAKEIAYLTVRARGAAKRKLREAGKVTVKAKVAYTPSGGKALRASTAVVLKKR